MQGDNPRRLLVVSDMHLGRDCKEITGFNAPRPDAKFDQAFIDMLDHYTSAREEEWRLVLAGDFVDFVEVVVAPAAQGPLKLHLSFDVSEEERAYGLGTEAERTLVKLDKTFEYHRMLFLRLAHFVREGGELVIVRGNHDVEFHWRKVQRVFRRMLADLAFSGMQLDVDQAIERRNDFQSRVRFSPWMYYEPGRVYIEHGHQYDPYCSFDLQLYPVSPTNPRRIDTPVFMFAMRYFVNMMQDFAPHNAEMWTFRDYVDWLRQKGLSGFFYTVRMAVMTALRMLVYGVRFAYGRVGRYTKEHSKRLGAVAEVYGMTPETLEKVDGLRHVPVNRNLPELMRLLFLDRILLAGGAIVTCIFFLLVFENPWLDLAGVLVTGAAAWSVNRRLAPRRYLLPGPKQRQAALRIARMLDVPLVVMGHSHVRQRIDLGSGRTYVNTGCWLPPLPNNDHSDPKAPCTCKLSHLVVDDVPELRVFCKVKRTVRVADLEDSRAQVGEDRPGSLSAADLPSS